METSTSKQKLLAEFGYLLEKIENADFNTTPFKFVLIKNFLSKEHFEEITTAQEIKRPKASTTENLIEDLQQNGYSVQMFPGCTTSVEEYLHAYNTKIWKVDKKLLEGFGLTLRLKEYKTSVVSRLVEFLNLPEFKAGLEKKFNITKNTYVETAIQKYLHGYEISPHPDARLKAATYMLNINTDDKSENLEIHTHLLRFKDEKAYIYDFWKSNSLIDRCWVPWDWCESEMVTNINNSIVVFAPSDDTLHAVKLDYDHLNSQRTQVYGNLWYTEKTAKFDTTYKDLSRDNIKRIQAYVTSLV